MKEVKLIRLLNGEELLAELKDSGVLSVTLKNPIRILVMPNKMDPKTPSVGFAPWFQFSDQEEISVRHDHIIAIVEPVREFVDQYNKTFSKIVTPNQQIIIPGAR